MHEALGSPASRRPGPAADKAPRGRCRGRYDRAEYAFHHCRKRFAGMELRVGAVGRHPRRRASRFPPVAIALGAAHSRGLLLPTACHEHGLVRQPVPAGRVELLHRTDQRGRILLQVTGNPGATTQVVVRGAKAIGGEGDQTGPERGVTSANGPARVVHAPTMSLEAGHPRDSTVAPSSLASEYRCEELRSAGARAPYTMPGGTGCVAQRLSRLHIMWEDTGSNPVRPLPPALPGPASGTIPPCMYVPLKAGRCAPPPPGILRP